MEESWDFVWAHGACMLGHYFSSWCILSTCFISDLDAARVVFGLFLPAFACALLDWDYISGDPREELSHCSILDHWCGNLDSFGNPEISFVGLLKNQMDHRDGTV